MHAGQIGKRRIRRGVLSGPEGDREDERTVHGRALHNKLRVPEKERRVLGRYS